MCGYVPIFGEEGYRTASYYYTCDSGRSMCGRNCFVSDDLCYRGGKTHRPQNSSAKK